MPANHSRSSRRPELPGLPPVSAPSSPASPAPRNQRKGGKRKQSPRSSSPLRRMLNRLWFGVRVVVVVVVALLALGLFLLRQQVHPIAEVVTVPDVRPNPALASPLLGGINVLLVGVDERPDHPEEGVRSDTLILAHVNMINGWINLLSIPRDTQVEMADIGPTKINVAYGQGYARAETLYGPGTTAQQGGMALAAQTVEQFFDTHGRGVRIHYTAQVNFAGFVEVIDALGGITVDVPYHIVDYAYPTPDFGVTTVEFLPGPQQMDGETALIYARTRHADDDFNRARRQQQVIRAVVAEFQAAGWLQRVRAVRQVVERLEQGATPPILTTMPLDRVDMLVGLLVLAKGLEPDQIGQLRITPQEVDVVEEGTNLLWDSFGVRALLDRLIVPPPPAPGEEGQVTSDE
jgi:polyisoprenyl-teichoic acid--peptidoglycan teichoic acid transferase